MTRQWLSVLFLTTYLVAVFAQEPAITSLKDFPFPDSEECASEAQRLCEGVMRQCTNGRCTESCLTDNFPLIQGSCLTNHPCAKDIDKHCAHLDPGKNMILTCLKGVKAPLEPACLKLHPCLNKGAPMCMRFDYETGDIQDMQGALDTLSDFFADPLGNDPTNPFSGLGHPDLLGPIRTFFDHLNEHEARADIDSGLTFLPVTTPDMQPFVTDVLNALEDLNDGVDDTSDEGDPEEAEKEFEEAVERGKEAREKAKEMVATASNEQVASSLAQSSAQSGQTTTITTDKNSGRSTITISYSWTIVISLASIIFALFSL